MSRQSNCMCWHHDRLNHGKVCLERVDCKRVVKRIGELMMQSWHAQGGVLGRGRWRCGNRFIFQGQRSHFDSSLGSGAGRGFNDDAGCGLGKRGGFNKEGRNGRGLGQGLD